MSKMKVEQIYTPGLAQAAYYIESQGEAAVVDPIRKVDAYLERAGRSGAKIKYVFETHVHADFVSGHLDLARQTGATIVFGPGAKTGYEKTSAASGEIFRIGDLTLQALHTPGHTLESTCFLLSDPAGTPYCVFTGDTLLIGDVGRPDLVPSDPLFFQEDMAKLHFQSLQRQLLPLPDNVIVYPGHGQGAACGRNISPDLFSTVGAQKHSNAAFAVKAQRDFVAMMTAERGPVPSYFPRNMALNRRGYADFRDVRERALRRLSPAAVQEAAEKAQIIDIRGANEFGEGFIPGSINIGIDGMFTAWAGILIRDAMQPLILVGSESRIEEAIIQLAQIGYDNILGFLDGQMRSWKLAGYDLDRIASIDAERLANLAKSQTLNILDCRTCAEFDSMHVDNAILFPLNIIYDKLHLIDSKDTFYIYCQSGYRSMAAASVLHKHGLRNVVSIHDGFNALQNTAIPTSLAAQSTDRNQENHKIVD